MYYQSASAGHCARHGLVQVGRDRLQYTTGSRQADKHYYQINKKAKYIQLCIISLSRQGTAPDTASSKLDKTVSSTPLCQYSRIMHTTHIVIHLCIISFKRHGTPPGTVSSTLCETGPALCQAKTKTDYHYCCKYIQLYIVIAKSLHAFTFF